MRNDYGKYFTHGKYYEENKEMLSKNNWSQNIFLRFIMFISVFVIII